MPLRRLREPPAWIPGLNPFALAGRAMRHFHPAAAPPLARANYRRELIATLFLPFALAAVEGGILGVIVKRYFSGLVDDGTLDGTLLDYAVAAVTAAPAFANITSFVFVRLAHGRDKVRSVNTLQLALAALIVLIAAAPRSSAGMFMTVGLGITARMCYAGVVTVRSAIWRANYPRHTRARLTGRFAAIQTLLTAMIGVCVGQVLELSHGMGQRLEAFAASADGGVVGAMISAASGTPWDPETWFFRLAIVGQITVSLVGVWWWSRVRVRGHAALLKTEREAEMQDRPSFNPFRLASILINDARFAGYMAAQFVMGAGNMMTFAVVVILTQDVFDLGYRDAMLATQVIPYLMIPLFVGAWSGLLDRWHVIRYRAVHSWVFVVMALLLAGAAYFEIAGLLFASAAVRGVGFSGGAIAWNLGHNDFARDDNAAQYMAVHVTLTGIRGLIAPFLGVAIYGWSVEHSPLGGATLFLISAVTIATGAIGFAVLDRVGTRENAAADV
ncbi:MAG: hypothetical protein CMJ31_11470 [Phycisphaerae bacterium]|nr:hypothetical protein [Phycisphaerae bacterium]